MIKSTYRLQSSENIRKHLDRLYGVVKKNSVLIHTIKHWEDRLKVKLEINEE